MGVVGKDTILEEGRNLYEVMDLFGLINTDPFGNKSYSDEGVVFATQILDTINEVQEILVSGLSSLNVFIQFIHDFIGFFPHP